MYICTMSRAFKSLLKHEEIGGIYIEEEEEERKMVVKFNSKVP